MYARVLATLHPVSQIKLRPNIIVRMLDFKNSLFVLTTKLAENSKLSKSNFLGQEVEIVISDPAK